MFFYGMQSRKTHERDVSLTALLTHLLGSASGDRKKQLEQMLAAAQKLNDEGSK